MKFSEFLSSETRNKELNEGWYSGEDWQKIKVPKKYLWNSKVQQPKGYSIEIDKFRKRTKAAQDRLLMKSYDAYKDLVDYEASRLTKERADNITKIVNIQKKKIQDLIKDLDSLADKYPGAMSLDSAYKEIQLGLKECDKILDDMDFEKVFKKELQHAKEAVEDYIKSCNKKLKEVQELTRNFDKLSTSKLNSIKNFMIMNSSYVRGTWENMGSVIYHIKQTMESKY